MNIPARLKPVNEYQGFALDSVLAMLDAANDYQIDLIRFWIAERDSKIHGERVNARKVG